MKLYFMKEEALNYFKDNVKYNLKNYTLDDNNWIYEKYEEPLQEFKIPVPDFSLEMNSDKPESLDYINVKILYDNLKEISDTQASDERFWVGLSHTHFWKFLKYRCKIQNFEEIKEEKILNNYFFKQGHKRSLITNPLSRLWWVGRLIYDKENKENPYYALEFLENDFSTKVLSLFSSNYTNNPKIARAVLVALAEIEKEVGKIERKKFHEILRYTNMIAGIIIIDYLTQDELKEKIKKHFYEKYLKGE
ncbi:DUF6339 family protein [Fusobacterium perfoetens]|uniref:DUF6339 family protein n=1 Tax=Fusobacterium perfoetens TaxID=852 RepID=UPI000481AFD5|nr:DUF6339 family protein [Fusobacterium perfoetens]